MNEYKIGPENLKRRDFLGDLGVDGKIRLHSKMQLGKCGFQGLDFIQLDRERAE
jgi:hypothetical protein